MKIWDLIKAENIKNRSWFKGIFCIAVLFLASSAIIILLALYNDPTNDVSVGETQYQLEMYLNIQREEYQRLQKGLKENTLGLNTEFEKELVSLHSQYLEEFVGEIDQFKQEIPSIYSWQYYIREELIAVKEEIYILERYYHNREDKAFQDFLSEDSDLSYGKDTFYQTLKEYYQKSSSELESAINAKKEYLKNVEQLLKEGIFYRYLEYMLKVIKSGYDINQDTGRQQDTDYFMQPFLAYPELADSIIEQKVEEEQDYRVQNVYRLQTIPSCSISGSISNDEGRKRACKREEEWANEKKEILKYSTTHAILSAIPLGDTDEEHVHMILSSKIIVDGVKYLGIVILILIIFTSGDILTREKVSGEENILLTSPNKRGKIFLAKFLYIALECYSLWLIGLFLFIIISGNLYGFHEIFTPALVYKGGKVVESFYLLTVLKDIFLASIPILAFLSIYFLLSLFSKKTFVVAGISFLGIALSSVSWSLIVKSKTSILAYMIFPYLDYAKILNHTLEYESVLAIVDIKDSTGIIISILTFLICYGIGNFVYAKREIKND